MKKTLFLIGRINYFLFRRLLSDWQRVKNALNTGYQSTGMCKSDSSILFEYPSGKIVGRQYISIGKFSTFGKRIILAAWKISDTMVPEIIIGDRTHIGDDCFVTCSNKIVIGNDVLIAEKVTITDNSHGKIDSISELSVNPSKRHPFSKGPVIIGNNVWICDKVTICPNVTIGEGAIIGANSVVTRDVPPFSIVAGVPAQIKKTINS